MAYLNLKLILVSKLEKKYIQIYNNFQSVKTEVRTEFYPRS